MDQAICFHKFSLYQMYLCMYVSGLDYLRRYQAFNLYILFVATNTVSYYVLKLLTTCSSLTVFNFRQQLIFSKTIAVVYKVVATGDILWNECVRGHG